MTGPLLGEERGATRLRPDPAARLRAARPAHHRQWAGARQRRPAVPDTLIEIWQANAAGRYRHEVDRWPAPLDPNFTGLGRTMTDGEGRYRFMTDQARRVPVEQSPQRLAPGAHPLLAVRPRVRAAPGHPDVLPGRPALPYGPDHEQHPRPGGPAAAGQQLRDRPDRARLGARLLGTSCCVGATRRRSRARLTRMTSECSGVVAVADRRAIPCHRAHLGGWGGRRARGHSGGDPDRSAGCSTGTARWCRTG